MQHFRHYTTAHSRQTVKLLRRKFGHVGPDTYWVLMEVLAEKIDYNLQIEHDFELDYLAIEAETTEKELIPILDHLHRKGKIITKIDQKHRVVTMNGAKILARNPEFVRHAKYDQGRKREKMRRADGAVRRRRGSAAQAPRKRRPDDAQATPTRKRRAAAASPTRKRVSDATTSGQDREGQGRTGKDWTGQGGAGGATHGVERAPPSKINPISPSSPPPSHDPEPGPNAPLERLVDVYVETHPTFVGQRDYVRKHLRPLASERIPQGIVLDECRNPRHAKPYLVPQAVEERVAARAAEFEGTPRDVSELGRGPREKPA